MASEEEEEVLSFGSEEGQNGDLADDDQNEFAEVRWPSSLPMCPESLGDLFKLRASNKVKTCIQR